MTIVTLVRAPGACLLLVVCGTACCHLLAGPPLTTDDPETPGRGGWEINISHNIEKTRDELLTETPSIDINYGRLENDQWKIEFPVLFSDPRDEQGQWGVGDVQLGWKYRFLEEDEYGFMASVYPQPLFPTGDRRLGLGGGRFELLLPLQVGKHFCDERVFVYGEVGYNVVFGDSDDNELVYGIAAAWQVHQRLELMAEVGGAVFPEGGQADDTFFNVGLKRRLGRNWALIGSAGRSFHDRQHGTPELLTFVGLQFTAGDDSSESGDR